MDIKNIDKAVLKFIKTLGKINTFEDIIKISISLINITKAIRNYFPAEYSCMFVYYLYELIETKTQLIRKDIIVKNIEKPNIK